jgi:hypothetical protein
MAVRPSDRKPVDIIPFTDPLHAGFFFSGMRGPAFGHGVNDRDHLQGNDEID